MFALFRALSDRLKALFVTTAALDFEADLLVRDAERTAGLLREADRYETEGLVGIGQQLRRQAEQLSLQRPLASVQPAVEYLLGKEATADRRSVQPLLVDAPPAVIPFAKAPKTKKKGK